MRYKGRGWEREGTGATDEQREAGREAGRQVGRQGGGQGRSGAFVRAPSTYDVKSSVSRTMKRHGLVSDSDSAVLA